MLIGQTSREEDIASGLELLEEAALESAQALALEEGKRFVEDEGGKAAAGFLDGGEEAPGNALHGDLDGAELLKLQTGLAVVVDLGGGAGFVIPDDEPIDTIAEAAAELAGLEDGVLILLDHENDGDAEVAFFLKEGLFGPLGEKLLDGAEGVPCGDFGLLDDLEKIAGGLIELLQIDETALGEKAGEGAVAHVGVNESELLVELGEPIGEIDEEKGLTHATLAGGADQKSTNEIG